MGSEGTLSLLEKLVTTAMTAAFSVMSFGDFLKRRCEFDCGAVKLPAAAVAAADV